MYGMSVMLCSSMQWTCIVIGISKEKKYDYSRGTSEYQSKYEDYETVSMGH